MIVHILKASRIILATDGDQPGQALAEELARRLGRERLGCLALFVSGGMVSGFQHDSSFFLMVKQVLASHMAKQKRKRAF